ncbi:hypothetical protein [Chromobacterium subtsugae]|uniref:hypothetical protein n=3 Tax=Chromobacterium subtsugae TaxID=251747 RepID=UPI00064176FE|nr:hypothetical protein [Chromobacterium subtsugae]OBU85691.1 hypothetical protein MY55_14975 [Chromobacterium subtsugae]
MEEIERREPALTPQDKAKRALLAAATAGYAGFSCWQRDFYVPGKHGPGVHLHGWASYMLEAALLIAALLLLLPLATRRPLSTLAWGLFLYGLFGGLLLQGLSGNGAYGVKALLLVLALLPGALAVLLGRLPTIEAYRDTRKRVGQQSQSAQTPLPAALGWLAAALLGLLGLILTLAALLLLLGGTFVAAAVLLLIGAATLAWTYFIIQRLRAGARR